MELVSEQMGRFGDPLSWNGSRLSIVVSYLVQESGTTNRALCDALSIISHENITIFGHTLFQSHMGNPGLILQKMNSQLWAHGSPFVNKSMWVQYGTIVGSRETNCWNPLRLANKSMVFYSWFPLSRPTKPSVFQVASPFWLVISLCFMVYHPNFW